jgi:hypothetical protein
MQHFASLVDCVIDDNVGDGILGGCSLLGCSVTGNSGSGIRLPGSPMIGSHFQEGAIRNSMIAGNGGSGVAGTNGPVVITNSVVSANGGASVALGTMTLVNSTLSGNGSGLAVGGTWGSHADVDNCILFGNGLPAITLDSYYGATASVDHSLVEGGWTGSGNVDADPLFVDAISGDFGLLPNSPCLDTGNNLAVPLDVWTDLAGKFRFLDGTGAGLGPRLLPRVDMGALEFGNDPPRKVRRR